MAGKSTTLEMVLKFNDQMSKKMGVLDKNVSHAAKELKQFQKASGEAEKQLKDFNSFKKLKRDTDTTTRAWQDAERQASDLTRQVREMENPTASLVRKQKSAIKTARRLSQTRDAQSQKLETLRRRMRSIEGLTGGMSDRQRQLKKRMESANRGIEEQRKKLGQLGRQQRDSAKAAKEYARIQDKISRIRTKGTGAALAGGGALFGLLGQSAGSDEASARLSAASGSQAQELRQIIDAVYKSGLGDSQSDVGRTLGSVSSSFGGVDDIGKQQVEALTKQTQTLVDTFEVGARELNQSANIMVENGLAAAPTKALDMIATAFKRVPAGMRDEILENLHEYGVNLKALGFSGDQAMAQIVRAAQRGRYALDKTGDSLKEFTVRASDMSKASQAAYETLGLDAEKMSNKVAQGGKGAQDALLTVSKRLLQIEEPAKRANTAIALFGTPLEDLSVDRIPAFLKSLTKANQGLGATAGVTQDMADKLRNTLPNAFGRLGRMLKTTAGDALADYREMLTGSIEAVLKFAEEHKPLMKVLVKVAAVVAAIAGTLGSITLALLSVLGPAALLRASFQTLGIGSAVVNQETGSLASRVLPKVASAFRALGVAMLTTPIGWVITGIAALAGAAYLLYRHWDSVSAWFGQRWADIKAAFGEGITGIQRLLINWSPIGLIYRGITAGLEMLGVNVPAQFRTLGSAIVDGLIGGITDMGGALMAKIKGLAGSTAGWFKDALGIKSPSRVFAGFGRNTVEGYRLGLAQREPDALRDMGRITKNLTAAGAGAALLAGSGGASAGQPAITYDNRPPVQATSASATPVQVNFTGDVYINNGTDENAFMARVQAAVNAALAERDNQTGARRRSALYDTE